MRSRFTILSIAALAALSISGQASAQQQETPPTNPPAQAQAPEAQTPAAAEPEGKKSATEEILVTGSRVRRKDLTTPAPVTVISREQIQASSATNIGDFLQLIPEQGGGTNTQVNNGGDGETQISLRNLGVNRTLVLVDGKRFVIGGSGAGLGVDLNSIPTAAVERVEILKDGASAVYGSDAIGGVVNIITRKRVDGVQLNGYGGTSQKGDATVYSIDILSGARSDRGGFMLGAGYFTQSSMFASSRDWANVALKYDFVNRLEGTSGSPTTPKTRVNALDPTTCAGVSPLCAKMVSVFGAGKKNYIYDPGTTLTNADGWRPRDANIDFFNYQAVNYLITPSNRIQLFGNGELRLSDWARAYTQASYVNRQSRIQIAPEPFVTTGNPALAVDPANPYNPFGVRISSINRRLLELSGRAQSFDLDTFRVVSGIDGTLPAETGPLAGWFWDASFNYGRTAGLNTVTGFLNTQYVGAGLGPGYIDATGVAHCGTVAKTIANCTPINLFGPAGSLTPDMVTQLGAYTGPSNGWNQLASTQLNLSGELFAIAADRPVALALGYEHRNEYGGAVPNPILSAGWDSDTGAPGPGVTTGSFYTNEGYGELLVPVLSHVPGVEDLEAQFAARVSNYNTFGTNTTYKMGARWAPIRDVTFRGTYSTGFRAPFIGELYASAGAGNYESATDPCAATIDPAIIAACGPAANNGITIAQVNSVTGGNPKLQPETAKIGTLGAVFQPSIIKNFSVTVDYYTISLDQTIGTWGSQLIMNKCYGAGVTRDTTFCNLIERDPVTNSVFHVTDINANVGKSSTSGIDLALQYALPTEVGRFLFQFNGNYLLKYDTTLPDGTLIKGAGNYDGSGGGQAIGATLNPRVKFNVGLSYSIGGLTAFGFGRYIGPFTECAPDGGVVAGASTGPGYCYQHSGDPPPPDGTGLVYPTHRVSPYVTFDLMLGYRLNTTAGTSKLTLGMRNVGNTRPPRVYDSFLTYADPSYDFAGRYLYGRIEHAF
jgi:outer membrane receptor protein involved in Fe transport